MKLYFLFKSTMFGPLLLTVNTPWKLLPSFDYSSHMKNKSISSNTLTKHYAGAFKHYTAEEECHSSINLSRSADGISRKAYYRYVNQNLFSDNHDQDWHEAEAQLIAEHNNHEFFSFQIDG